jgi:hypothetical protein
MQYKGIEYPWTFDMGLSSAEGQKLECFKSKQKLFLEEIWKYLSETIFQNSIVAHLYKISYLII